jgi:glycosyltransferase involved in cell wall biosynthesis
LKFCIVGPVWPFRGGISHHSAILSKALTNEGHEVKIITFKRQYPQWLYPGRTDQDNSKNPIKASAEYILDPFSPFSWRKAATRALLFKPDLVMIQWWTFFWSVPFAWMSRYLHQRGVRVAYLIHNVSSHEAHPLDRFFSHLAWSGVPYFLVFSEFEKHRLHKLLPGKRVVLTHLPVYAFSNDEQLSKSEARRILNLPQEETMLLFFGFVRPYKGLDVLLKALANLKQKGIYPYLAIVGEFWKDKQSYLDSITRSGIGEQVRIEDRYVPNEEADLWFRGADLLVAPYTHGVTQSAVASLALGYNMPMIVTTQVAGGLEPGRHPAIQVVPPDDAEALENEIAAFIRLNKKKDNYVKPEPAIGNSITGAILELTR